MEEHWKALIAKFVKITDRLGMPIDDEIFEVVVALNALNITTIMSCGGHIDERGLIMPWVDVSSPDPALEEVNEESHRLAKEARMLGRIVDDIPREDKERRKDAQRALDEKYVELRRNQRKERAIECVEREKLIPYLSQFYEGRSVPFDRRLHFNVRAGGRTRLENQAAGDFYIFSDLETQKRKLSECQEEFSEFARFLKAIYFSKEPLAVTSA